LFLSLYDRQQHFSHDVLATDNNRLTSQLFNNTYQVSACQGKNGEWAREISGAAHLVWRNKFIVRSLEILI
jgi:hypothetical protein